MTRVDRFRLAFGLCALWLLPAVALAQPAPEESAIPAVEPSPLLKEPQTPTEIFEAVVLLVDLGRFDLAELYLQQFVDGQPTDDLLQQLRDKYGTGEFLRLTRVEALKPTARPLLDRLNEASRKQAEDPAYIDGLITRLSGSPLERELAVRELRNAGIRAVPQILRKLVTAKTGSERDFLVAALARMGQPIVPALVAGLDSSNNFVRDGCIEALRLLKAESAVPRLWPLAYLESVPLGTRDAALGAIASIRFGNVDRVDRLSDSQATEELGLRARRLLSEEAASSMDVDTASTVTVWSWDDNEQTLTARELEPADAALEEAVRSARDAFSLQPDREVVQTLYLTAVLGAEVNRAGWDTILSAENSPAVAMGISAGVDPLLKVLKSALSISRTDAAWAALQCLSPLASKDLLRRRDGIPSPVVGALNFPDPRIQFAAAMVCLRSDPTLTFPGASRVGEILRRALTDPGQAVGLIIDSNLEEASQLGTYIDEQGFVPLIAHNGREGFEQAATQAGVGLIVVQANVANWGLTQTLSNLRADARTSYIPIIVYGPDNVRAATAHLVARTGNAVFVGESPAAASFWLQALPFIQQRRTPPLSEQLRQDFKSIATYWLAELSTNSSAKAVDINAAEELLLPLIQEPEISSNVLVALEHVGTPTLQTRLTEFVLSEKLPLETRIQTAQSLVTHIRRFGLLLSQDDVTALNAAWIQASDPGLRGALTAVVGSLQPNPGLVGERLKQFSVTP